MQIIAELEGAPRGPYTGSLGYLNHDGWGDFNILIRTISVLGKQLELRAGAGIVADSRPERELEESRAKARGMVLAPGAMKVTAKDGAQQAPCRVGRRTTPVFRN